MIMEVLIQSLSLQHSFPSRKGEYQVALAAYLALSGSLAEVEAILSELIPRSSPDGQVRTLLKLLKSEYCVPEPPAIVEQWISFEQEGFVRRLK